MNSSTASPTITTTTPAATTATTTTAINADAKTEPESVTATPAVNQQQPIKEQQETNNNNDQQVQISADYLAQLIKDKKQLAAFPSVFIHVQRLIDDEINKVRQSLFQLSDVVHQLEPLELPEPEGEFVQLQEKLYVPVDEHPEYNFVGRLLGPRGMTAKQLEQETGCKIMIRGRGSMRDKKKEEQNRGKANWEHLNDELHVLITVEDTQNRAQLKLDRALEEVKHLLVPIVDGEDELKKRQLMELAIINGTYQRHYNGQNYPANSANINGSSVSSGIPSTGSNTPNSVHGPPAGLKSHQRTHNSNKQQQQQQQASQHSHQAHKQQQVNAAHLHQHSPSPHHPQPAGPLPQQHHQHPGHQQQQLANHLPPHLHHHPHHPHPHQSTAVAAAAAAAAAALMANPADPSALLYAQQYHDFHHYAALAAAAAAAQQQQHLLGPPPDYHAQQQAGQQQPPSAVAAAVAQAVAQANQQIQQHHHHHHHQQQQHYQHQIESEQQHQAALAACYNQQAHHQQQQQQHLIVNQPDSLAGETQMNGNDNTREHPDPELAHEEPMAKASGLAGNNRLAQHHQEQQIANSSDTANMCG